MPFCRNEAAGARTGPPPPDAATRHLAGLAAIATSHMQHSGSESLTLTAGHVNCMQGQWAQVAQGFWQLHYCAKHFQHQKSTIAALLLPAELTGTCRLPRKLVCNMVLYP